MCSLFSYCVSCKIYYILNTFFALVCVENTLDHAIMEKDIKP